MFEAMLSIKIFEHYVLCEGFNQQISSVQLEVIVWRIVLIVIDNYNYILCSFSTVIAKLLNFPLGLKFRVLLVGLSSQRMHTF